jgi:hypothetical protein
MWKAMARRVTERRLPPPINDTLEKARRRQEVKVGRLNKKKTDEDYWMEEGVWDYDLDIPSVTPTCSPPFLVRR